MNDESRPKAAPESATTEASVPRAGVLYLIQGTKQTRSGPETVSVYRRTRPAAYRAAVDMELAGRGPAAVWSVPLGDWQYEDPEGFQ